MSSVTDKSDLVQKPQETERAADGPPAQLGRWYWVKDEDGDEWLGCVTHLGSNYALLEGPSESSGRPGSTSLNRVHFRDFDATCRPEPDASGVVARKVAEQREIIDRSVRKLGELQSRLAIGAAAGPDTTALATYRETSMAEYKKSLERALKHSVPKMQDIIEKASQRMAMWMQAETVAYRPMLNKAEEVAEAVKKRIFGVRLYAGLAEGAVKVQDGPPAAASVPLHVFQRRHYMDEECLANYRAGGLRFEHLEEFDQWLVLPDNFRRVFPYPRSSVAFRVRRREARKEALGHEDFVSMLFSGKDVDMSTFFYVRNGEQLWRIAAEIDFGEKLFPDAEKLLPVVGGRLYIVREFGGVDRIATEGEYLELLRLQKEEEREREAMPEDERWRYSSKLGNANPKRWVPWDHETVYYDDACEYAAQQAEEHNRFVLFLQGLYDRSEVLSPHPKVQLWVAADFAACVSLVYDQDRAIVSGDAPDFAAYQAGVNSKVVPGSVVVGQQDYWQKKAAEEEQRRLDARYGYGKYTASSRYEPPGDPGPGEAARVVRVRGGKCTFEWKKVTTDRYGNEKYVKKSISVPLSELLCADAYQPGDYHLFYDDPRTRADYLAWAPLLLLAEEYRAGELEVGSDPAKPGRRWHR